MNRESFCSEATLSLAMVREYPPLEPDPVIEAYKKDVDRTLIRENLKLTPSQRVERLIELQRFAEGLKKAGDELRERKRQRKQQGHG
ncbi:MAG: hypothetical protein HOP15_11640 [Planctomycetes bacterium]|nr:hypothetical protein [Planctomycetota bacterium]